MTWLKLGDEFPTECDHLSDGAFRTHVEGLSFAMLKETGGRLDKRRIMRHLTVENPDWFIRELVECGFWADDGDHWTVRRHMNVQPSPEQIRKRREMEATRQAKARQAKLKLPPLET